MGIGVFILLSQFIRFSLTLVLIVTALLLLVIISYLYIRKKKTIISNIIQKQNVFEISSNNKVFTGSILKLWGKLEVDKGGANFQKELESLMETLSRRDVGFEYYVLTSLSKRKAISTLIVIKECSNCRDLVLEEIENIKNIANAVSPHIHLETVSSSERSLPVPGTWGNLSYAKIFEKIIDSPKKTHFYLTTLTLKLVT